MIIEAYKNGVRDFGENYVSIRHLKILLSILLS